MDHGLEKNPTNQKGKNISGLFFFSLFFELRGSCALSQVGEPWLVPGLGWELLPFVPCGGSGLWQWRRGAEVGQQAIGAVGSAAWSPGTHHSCPQCGTAMLLAVGGQKAAMGPHRPGGPSSLAPCLVLALGTLAGTCTGQRPRLRAMRAAMPSGPTPGKDMKTPTGNTQELPTGTTMLTKATSGSPRPGRATEM